MQTQQNASSSVAQSLNELQGRARGESEHQSEKQGPFDLERDLDAPSRETEHADCVETRVIHRYLVRRPRPLQYTYRSKVITVGNEHGILVQSASNETDFQSGTSRHLPEDIVRGRERLDLFVDLIWVGIISNLSEVFSTLGFKPEDPSVGKATLVFILVFLPSWRIWNSMREFLNNYYMVDMVQKTFKLWILVLSVFYGNQLAYLAEDIDKVKTWAISTYLVILASFVVIELVYSIFIKWLRRLILVHSVLRLPGIGFWIAATYLRGVYAVGPVVAAVAWEYMCAMIFSSRLADKLTPSEYKKALDVDHFQSRMASFFIITLGEGVLQLIKDGPLGQGLNGTTGIMVWILLIYYELSLLYFNGDGSKRFIPAIKQEGKKTLIWVSFHVSLFASILTFASGVMFIVRHEIKEQFDVSEEQQISDGEIRHYMHSAVWTSAISLAIIIFSMTCLALLDKSLDEPDILRINNRYIRIGGRLVYIIVILSVPTTRHINPLLFLGIAGLMLSVVTSWEWAVCMDRGSAFVEPDGLSLMMSRELKRSGQPHGQPERRSQRASSLARDAACR